MNAKSKKSNKSIPDKKNITNKNSAINNNISNKSTTVSKDSTTNKKISNSKDNAINNNIKANINKATPSKKQSSSRDTSKMVKTRNTKYVIINNSDEKITSNIENVARNVANANATTPINDKNYIATNKKSKKAKKNILYRYIRMVYKNIKKFNSKLTNFSIDIFKKFKFKPSIPKIVFPKFLEKAINPQLLATISLIILSIIFLLSSTAYNYIFSDNNVTQYYSAEGYSVYLGNNLIGNVRSKDEITEILSKIKKEYEEKNNTTSNIVTNFVYTEGNFNDSELTSSESLYTSIKALVEVKSVAYGVFVDGKRIGAFQTEKEANNLLDDVSNYFTKDIDKENILSSSFDENVEVKKIDINLSELSDKETLLEYIIIGTDEKITYTVQEGDSYWEIASRNGMTTEELFAANPQADANSLFPNDELSLVVPKPIISVNTKRNIIEQENIPFETETEYVSYMYNDQQQVKKNGVYGVAEVGYTLTEQNGIEIAREEISRNVISEPQNKIILVGTQDPPPKVGSGVFIHPLPGSYSSSAFGPRWGTFHGGHDFAKASGSNILAADGGTVIFSGWGGNSYGYMVDIDHGGGWTTKYAHCSALYVSAGEKVYQGQTIAAVGSTGYSFGAHLHFEVMKYGTKLNPLNYIGQYYR